MIDPYSEYEEFAFLSPDVKPPLKKYFEDVNRKEENRLIPCIGSISVRDSQTASYWECVCFKLSGLSIVPYFKL